VRPPNLLKDESLRTIQRNLQDAFLLNGNGVAKRYLRFLLQRIEINGDEVRIEADAATLVAGGLQLQPSGDVNQLTPVLSVDYDWVPDWRVTATGRPPTSVARWRGLLRSLYAPACWVCPPSTPTAPASRRSPAPQRRTLPPQWDQDPRSRPGELHAMTQPAHGGPSCPKR